MNTVTTRFQALKLSSLIRTAYSTEDVVDLINDGTFEGGLKFSGEKLAAQHAYQSASESGNEISVIHLEAYLDALQDNGANFNPFAALEYAIKITLAYAHDDTSDVPLISFA